MKNTASMSGSGGNANAALNLLIALMLFVVTELPEENQNMVELYNLITLTNPKVLDAIFDGLDATHPAKKPYLIYAQSLKLPFQYYSRRCNKTVSICSGRCSKYFNSR